jgi:hypothetical protein
MVSETGDVCRVNEQRILLQLNLCVRIISVKKTKSEMVKAKGNSEEKFRTWGGRVPQNFPSVGSTTFPDVQKNPPETPHDPTALISKCNLLQVG